MSLQRFAFLLVLGLPLASCGLFDGEPDTPAPAAEAAAAPNPGSAPLIPLRPGPQTLLGFQPSDAKPAPSNPAPAPLPALAPTAPPAQAAGPSSPKPAAHRDDLGADEAQSFYEGVMLTYAFDACGLPLLGETARQDIGHRIEICPNTEARKTALRSLYRRALTAAERDAEKLRADALNVCKDKRAFLSNVMSHAQQLRFDDGAPPDCSAISPPP